MTILKKITAALVVLGLLFGLTLGALAWWVSQNQQMLSQRVSESVNDQLVGQLFIGGMSLAPFKNFPYLSIDLQDVAFYASADTVGQKPIYHFEDVYVGVDVWELVQGDLSVKRIRLESGRLHLVTDENGLMNLLTAKSAKEADEEEDEETEGIKFDIDTLLIKDLVVEKENRQTDEYYRIRIDQATSTIRLHPDSVGLHLETNFVLEDLMIADSHWVTNKHLHFDIDATYRTAEQYLALRPSRFEIEKGEFWLEGFVNFADSNYLDLTMKGRKPNFDLLLAFAPNEVGEKMKTYQNEGQVFFEGHVLGHAVDGQQPHIELQFGCENAQFVHPDGHPLQDFNLTGFFTNGDSNSLATSELFIRNIKGKPNKGLFEGMVHLKNFADPQVTVDFHASLDMHELEKFLDIDGFRGIRGQTKIDITVDELLDFQDVSGNLSKIKEGVESRIVLQKATFQLPGYPLRLENFDGAIHAEKGTVILDSLKGKIGQSDVMMHGTFSGFGAMFHRRNQPVRLQLFTRSNLLDLRELLAYDPELSRSVDETIRQFNIEVDFQTTGRELWKKSGLPVGSFEVRNLYAKMEKFPHLLHNFHAQLITEPDKVTLRDFSGKVDGSDFRLTASLAPYQALLDSQQVKPVQVGFELTSNMLFLDDFLVYNGTNHLPAEYRGEQVKGLVLRGEVATTNQSLMGAADLPDFQLNLKDLQGKFQFHPLALRDFKGKVEMAKGQIGLKGLGGKIGSSDFTLDGVLENFMDTLPANDKGWLTLTANRLDFDELLSYEAPSPADTVTKDHDSGANVFALPFPELKLEAHIGHMRHHKMLFDGFYAKARTQVNHYVYIDTLFTGIAEGKIGLKGYFNGSDTNRIYFSSRMALNQVNLQKLFIKLDNMGQDMLVSDNIQGKLTALITSNVRMHRDFTPMLEETDANIQATIRDGQILRFAPMQAMSKYFADKNLSQIRFGELTNNFEVKKGVLYIPKMEISSSIGFINLAGKQSAVDLSMDYQIEVPMQVVKGAVWSALFKKEGVADSTQTEQQVISSENTKARNFVRVRVVGTPDKYDIKLGKK